MHARRALIRAAAPATARAAAKASVGSGVRRAALGSIRTAVHGIQVRDTRAAAAGLVYTAPARSFASLAAAAVREAETFLYQGAAQLLSCGLRHACSESERAVGVHSDDAKMKFRPCIDLHDGVVKQIVGGTLSDAPGAGPVTNFVATKSAAEFARYAEVYFLNHARPVGLLLHR